MNNLINVIKKRYNDNIIVKFERRCLCLEKH